MPVRASNVISLFRRQRAAPEDWSQSELAQFYRVEAALIQAGLAVEQARGLTDEGEPWFAFCHADTGDVFAHFARIDGVYIVDSPAVSEPLADRDFTRLISRMADAHPFLLPDGRKGGVTRLYMHPAALLVSAVAVLFFKTVPSEAGEMGPDGAPRLTDATRTTSSSPFVLSDLQALALLSTVAATVSVPWTGEALIDQLLQGSGIEPGGRRDGGEASLDEAAPDFAQFDDGSTRMIDPVLVAGHAEGQADLELVAKLPADLATAGGRVVTLKGAELDEETSETAHRKSAGEAGRDRADATPSAAGGEMFDAEAQGSDEAAGQPPEQEPVEREHPIASEPPAGSSDRESPVEVAQVVLTVQPDLAFTDFAEPEEDPVPSSPDLVEVADVAVIEDEASADDEIDVAALEPGLAVSVRFVSDYIARAASHETLTYKDKVILFDPMIFDRENRDMSTVEVDVITFEDGSQISLIGRAVELDYDIAV